MPEEVEACTPEGRSERRREGDRCRLPEERWSFGDPAGTGGVGARRDPSVTDDFTRVGEVLEALLPRVDSGAAALLRAWAEAVGEEAAAHSRPVKVRGGVLVVAVASPAWGQRLAMRESEICRRLASHAGAPEVVRLALRPIEWEGPDT